MNNQIYTPKKIQLSNITPINNQNQNIKFDINDFPVLNNTKLPAINTPLVNWSNIKQNINEENLKELNIKKKKREYINKQNEHTEQTEQTEQTDHIEQTEQIKQSEQTEQIKQSEQKEHIEQNIEELGWTHVIKSTKPKYKEKKRKNTEIDELVNNFLIKCKTSN